MDDRRPVTDDDILAARPPRSALDPWKPAAFLVEPERSAAGTIDDVATIFLTNKECPFRCTMCDLWKYTLPDRVPAGAIPAQIDYALERLPAARHVKLYNAGNFFDAQAIPPEDFPAIADRVRHFETVIVENHPRLTDQRCVRFRDLLGTQLEVALGLETIHPDILPGLNKRMTVADYDRAAKFLRHHEIAVRTFVLLKPPGLNERDAIDWTLRSIDHAFDAGSGCCSVVPTRGGNGYMELLQSKGEFAPPTIRSMEEMLTRAIEDNRGRTFMDLWDAEKFFDCPHCGPARAERIRRMNLSQKVEPGVNCTCSHLT
jgi:hypothetical protein